MHQMNSLSSTSSSECLCGECFNYGAAFQSSSFRSRTPYYQALGHPLVYYAQVQQPRNFRKRNRDSKKENPNCFVKAFRWYTQERCLPQNQELPNNCTDLNGFASWLDEKYDEFMLDKRAEQTTFQHQLPQQSQLEVNHLNPCVSCDPRQKKKGGRLKSPWRRMRRPSKSNESGDTLHKEHQSFQFILKPKELSHPTSECCHQISSIESQASKRTVVKVKGHSSDRTVYQNRDDMPHIEAHNIDGNKSDDKGPELTKQQSKTMKGFEDKPKGSQSSFKSVGGVTCQCSEQRVVTAHAQTQCDVDVKQPEYPLLQCDLCPRCVLIRNHLGFPVNSLQAREVEQNLGAGRTQAQAKRIQKHEEPELNVMCQCSEDTVGKRPVETQHEYEPRDCHCTADYELIAPSKTSSLRQTCQPKAAIPTIKCPAKVVQLQKPLVVINEGSTTARAPKRPCIIRLNNGAAQTSDHSICFEKDTYPLFMKIIRADKLSEDLARK